MVNPQVMHVFLAYIATEVVALHLTTSVFKNSVAVSACAYVMKYLAKLWQIKYHSPNSTKFFNAKVFFLPYGVLNH